ncbi:MAG: tol-pal system protein YbgF, partial [Desulfobacterales bacterium]|nr:tol-pal system protein YbgF [Desulfobacterales bacterium]
MLSFSRTKNIIKWALVSLSVFIFASCATSNQDLLYLNGQIITLGTRVDNELESVRDSQAETGAEIDATRGEIQDLSGRIEDLTLLVGKLEMQISLLDEQLELQSTSESTQPLGAESLDDTEGLVPQTPDTEEAVSPEEESYSLALATYDEGKYDEAIAGFNLFLIKYPKAELSETAQFLIGESYTSLEKYEQAILAYQKVIENYPDRNRVPAAMLQQALAFSKINDKTSATLLLQRIINKYPGSSEAETAEQTLQTL